MSIQKPKPAEKKNDQQIDAANAKSKTANETKSASKDQVNPQTDSAKAKQQGSADTVAEDGQVTAKISPLDVKQTHKISEHKHEIALTSLRADPTGRFVAAGAEDLDIQLWDLQCGDRKTLKGHQSWVRSFDFSQDGKRLYSACWGGQVKVWDLDEVWRTKEKDPEPIRTIDAHQGAARFVRLGPDGRHLATCGNDLLVKVWKLDNGQLTHSFSGHKRHVYGVGFHPAGEHLVSQDLMGEIFVWNLKSGKQERRVDGGVMTGYDNKFAADMGGARDMEFRSDGKQWASAGITKVTNSFAGVQEPIVVLFDWKSGKNVKQLQTNDKNVKGIAWGVRYHPQGFVIVAVADRSGKGELWFYKPDEDKPFHTHKLPSAARGLDLLPDGRQLVIAHADGAVRRYSMTAQESDAKKKNAAKKKKA